MKNFIGSRAMPEMAFQAPESLDALMALLREHRGNCRIVAGCTDFIPAVRSGRWMFDAGINIIDIRRIPGFAGISEETDTVTIGPCTRLTEILESSVIREKTPVLAEAIEQMASLQVRNVATIGGNVCMSSPAADTVPPLLVMGASLTLTGPDGDREVDLADFFTGPGQNVLEPDQVLTRISIPVPGKGRSARFLKIGTRTAVIISVVSAAVSIDLEDGLCTASRIALGSVAPTPVRVREAESILVGKALDDTVTADCARTAAQAITPITDVRASSAYRKDVAETLVRRAIQACREDLK